MVRIPLRIARSLLQYGLLQCENDAQNDVIETNLVQLKEKRLLHFKSNNADVSKHTDAHSYSYAATWNHNEHLLIY